MPNDQTLMPAELDAPESASSIADKVALWCTRAEALANDPALDPRHAACALDQLAFLQTELAEERLGLCRPHASASLRIKAWFLPLEQQVQDVHAALSAAAVARLDTHVNDDRPKTAALIDGRKVDLTTCGVELATAPRPAIIDRDFLDLDSLRPYLSDAAITEAVMAHSKATGRTDLRGVTMRDTLRQGSQPIAIV